MICRIKIGILTSKFVDVVISLANRLRGLRGFIMKVKNENVDYLLNILKDKNNVN